MKKAIIFIAYVIFIALIFSGCNLNPLNKDQFDLRDTVTIKINEKLYENKDLWIRLDSITRDNRCPEGYQCFVAGGVEAKFTIGYRDTTVTFKASTDSLIYKSILFIDRDTPGLINTVYYIFSIISASPERQADSEIPLSNYEIDFVLESGPMVEKPNIYLYPKFRTKMDVTLSLPRGGCICESDPAYPDEWQKIRVKPSGLINNEYEYLFYEAVLPDHWQYDSGWPVKLNELTAFFRANLTQYGFVDHEIDDFTDWWIPRLKDHPYYNIYPQHTDKVNDMVTLNISKDPESLLRLFYVIEAAPEKEDLPVPMIPTFKRNGFTVAEWGVILK